MNAPRSRESQNASRRPPRPAALKRLRQRRDRLLEAFFGGAPAGEAPEPQAWHPSLDVVEGERTVVVRAELPGIDPARLAVTLSGDRLTIAGEKLEQKEVRSRGVYRAERRFGSFERSIELPAAIDRDRIVAEYGNGILTVTIAKSAAARPRRIDVARLQDRRPK